MRHMLGRTLDHLHDTNDGEDVGRRPPLVGQLGYATFPCAPPCHSVVTAATRSDDRLSRGAAARSVLFGAAVVSFALVSSMRTEFLLDHVLFVALPSVAMLAGIWLDEIITLATARETRDATLGPPSRSFPRRS